MYGEDILCGISKGIFEIPHKVFDPYIGRCDSYKLLKFKSLRAHMRFWNASQIPNISEELIILTW